MNNKVDEPTLITIYRIFLDFINEAESIFYGHFVLLDIKEKNEKEYQRMKAKYNILKILILLFVLLDFQLRYAQAALIPPHGTMTFFPLLTIKMLTKMVQKKVFMAMLLVGHCQMDIGHIA